MQSIDVIFGLIVLIMSVVIHEVSHGVAANALGDPTARFAGRLTLNPLKHLDPIGSFLVPAALALMHLPILGWAKPVPYNPYNLQKGKWGPGLVAAAGPLSNLLLAVIFAIVIRIVTPIESLPIALIDILESIVAVNIVLCIFNLIPIPPLDGSKVLFAILPSRARGLEDFLNRYQIVLLVVIVFFAWRFIAPIIYFVFNLLT